MTILVLGGTTEARELAAALVAEGRGVLTSLAGRVSRPALPVGEVRIGGFGGAEGLAAYLSARTDLSAVVDATHPFADQISANAAIACAQSGVPLLRFERPGWSAHPDTAQWSWVSDDDAARRVADAARRPFLTTGRQSLERYLPWADRPVLFRVVDPPGFAVPPAWTMVRSRGPYGFAGERALLAEHRADVLITKDSGGRATAAKLDAARDLGVRVVVIARPPGVHGVPTTSDLAAALDFCATRHRSADGQRA